MAPRSLRTRAILIPSVLAVAALMAYGVSNASAGKSTSKPSDARARFVTGNVSRCSQLGFALEDGWLQVSGPTGDPLTGHTADGALAYGVVNAADVSPGNPVLLNDGTWSSNATILNAMVANGTEIGAVVVKGGNGYQVYSRVEYNMVSPLNGGGVVPRISHWFICYRLGAVTPPEPPSTEPPSTEPPSTEPPSTEPPATQPPATELPATEPQPSLEPVAASPSTDEPSEDAPQDA